MTKVFVITFKETGARHAYTSLAAVILMHPKSEIGVSQSSLEKFDFNIANYDNEKVVIEKFNALSTVEARSSKTIV